MKFLLNVRQATTRERWKIPIASLR